MSAFDHAENNQQDYLFLLRRCRNIDTLETVIGNLEKRLDNNKLCLLYSAADHRRVEIISGKLFDKVPASMRGIIK